MKLGTYFIDSEGVELPAADPALVNYGEGITARHGQYSSGSTSSPERARDVSRLFLFLATLGIYALVGLFLSVLPVLSLWLADYLRHQ